MFKRPRLGAVALIMLLTGAWIWGCSSSTDPGEGGELRVVFAPTSQFLELEASGSTVFQASPSRSASFSARWFLDGQQVGSGETYQYEASFVGDDTLVVETTLEGIVDEHPWRISVVPDPSLIPPPVPNISVTHGPNAMDVVLNWQYISGSDFPVVQYVVGGSYAGPITLENWDQADVLGFYTPVAGFAGHRDTLTAAENGMQAGATIWLAVRGIDDHGQISPIGEFLQHEISFPWYLEGRVVDSEGRPVPEAIIRFCEDQQGEACLTNTDATGFYRIGPVPSVESVTLKTWTSNVLATSPPFNSWYDFESEPIAYSEEGNVREITLVPRFPSDLDIEFMTLLRFMTKTDVITTLRPNQRLFRWEEYPIKVFVPDFVREGDEPLDFGAATRQVLGWWNEVLGEEYLVEVEDQADCDILIFFADLEGSPNGRTSLALPDDLPYVLGEVIPQRINIGINSIILPTVQRVQETVMHELGHGMGFYGHIPGVSGETYLMAVTSAHALDNGHLEAVHPNEVRMLHAIRHLPQGVDMSSFRLDDQLP